MVRGVGGVLKVYLGRMFSGGICFDLHKIVLSGRLLLLPE